MSIVKFIFVCGLFLIRFHAWSQTGGQKEVCTLSEEYAGIAEVYSYVDSMPYFPGGQEAIMKFITSHLQIPEDFISWNSKVITQFVVDTSGRLTDMKIKKGLNDDLNNAVLAVLDKMPPWIPGKCNGRLVPVVFTLPVIIELQ